MLVWLAIDGEGHFHGPFPNLRTFEGYRSTGILPAPVTLLEVVNDDPAPVFFVAGDALCDAMDTIIFQKRAEKREAFNRRVNWAAG